MLTFVGLFLQDNDDQTIQTAQLFPVFHAQEKVGLTEILWLQGEITDDDDKNILRRLVTDANNVITRGRVKTLAKGIIL